MGFEISRIPLVVLKRMFGIGDRSVAHDDYPNNSTANRRGRKIELRSSRDGGRRFDRQDRLLLQIIVDRGCRIAAILDAPDDQRSTAHNVAASKHAIDGGHHRVPIDLDGSPARDLKLRLIEESRQVFRIETQRLDG